ncbi:MAG: hypothetical protein AAFX52_09670 [Pseudomonadota bacterium]
MNQNDRDDRPEADKLPPETIAVHKEWLMNDLRRGLGETPAKVIAFDYAKPNKFGVWELEGYATKAKCLAGRKLEELDGLLGFGEARSVATKAVVLLATEVPASVDDFELRGLTHMEGGKFWNKGRPADPSKDDFIPGTGVIQFQLTKPLAGRLVHVLLPGDKITFQRSDYAIQ